MILLLFAYQMGGKQAKDLSLILWVSSLSVWKSCFPDYRVWIICNHTDCSDVNCFILFTVMEDYMKPIKDKTTEQMSTKWKTIVFSWTSISLSSVMYAMPFHGRVGLAWKHLTNVIKTSELVHCQDAFFGSISISLIWKYGQKSIHVFASVACKKAKV